MTLPHNQHLVSYIVEHIAQRPTGISFADYMQHALYAPNLGYYSSATNKFGTFGDFTTAPELSPLFGYTLARECAPIIKELSAPKILEFGAGSGALAVDLLKSLESLECLPEQYLILEVSAELKQRQQHAINTHIPQLAARVQWLSQLPATPFNGVIVANEVLDAMPVQRFKLEQNKLQEAYVIYQQHKFQEIYVASDNPQLHQLMDTLKSNLPQPYISEANLVLAAWLKSVFDIMNCGVALLIDYGFPRHEYYHPQRSMGTLMCHYQHRAHPDPYQAVGLQDITAHVDFTAVAEGASVAGWQVSGYTNQASFLLANDLITVAAELKLSPTEQVKLNQAIKTLTLPHEMGELFKVMALTKNYNQPLQGFNWLDLRHKL